MCYFLKERPKSRTIYGVVTTCNSGSLPERTSEKLEGQMKKEGGQLKPKSDRTIYTIKPYPTYFCRSNVRARCPRCINPNHSDDVESRPKIPTTHEGHDPIKETLSMKSASLSASLSAGPSPPNWLTFSASSSSISSSSSSSSSRRYQRFSHPLLYQIYTHQFLFCIIFIFETILRWIPIAPAGTETVSLSKLLI